MPVFTKVSACFDLDLVSASRTQAIDALLAQPRARVAFVNAHCVNVAMSDPTYRRALHSADMLLPDGAGLELAARMHGAQFQDNLNGTDLGPDLARALAWRGLSLFFAGRQAGRGRARRDPVAEPFAPGLKVCWHPCDGL